MSGFQTEDWERAHNISMPAAAEFTHALTPAAQCVCQSDMQGSVFLISKKPKQEVRPTCFFLFFPPAINK